MSWSDDERIRPGRQYARRRVDGRPDADNDGRRSGAPGLYAALKAGRPEIITGLVNRMIAMSTRFTPTSIFCLAERAKARKVLPPGEIAFAGDGHRQ
jgi:hypothetical protein